MVSELVLLRPTSVPTDDGFYVRVGPHRKKESLISDLKNFIELRFNSPRPQVLVGKDGGVVITGLYEGIPDDADYNHEAFDHIIDLVGWLEGCVEMPSASKEKGSVCEQLTESLVVEEISNQTAHQLLVELLKLVDINKGESMEQEESDQLESTVAKESLNLAAYQVLDKMLESKTDLNTLENLGFDPGGKCSVDLAHNSGLNDACDDALIMGECPIQMEKIHELLVVEETSNLDARQVFDKMLELQKWPELELRVQLPKGVNAISKHELVTSISTLLSLRGRADSKMSKVSEMVAYERVGSVMSDVKGEVAVQNVHLTGNGYFDEVFALIKLLKSRDHEPTLLGPFVHSLFGFQLIIYDPGIMIEERWKWKGFKLGGSLISDENLLVHELVDDEYDYKDARVGSVSGHKTDFCGHFGANSKQGQAKVAQNNVKGVMFDPGGAAYLPSPFLHLTRAAILGCEVNQPELLASEFSHAKVSFILQKLSLVDENDMFKLLHMLNAAYFSSTCTSMNYFSSTCTSMNSSDRANVIKSNLLITLGENNVAAGNLDELKVKIAMPWFVWLEGGVRKEVLVFTGECFDPGGDLNLDDDPLNWKSTLPKNNSGLLVKPVRSNSQWVVLHGNSEPSMISMWGAHSSPCAESRMDICFADIYPMKPQEVTIVNKMGEIVIFDPGGIQEFMLGEKLYACNKNDKMVPFDPGVNCLCKVK